MPEEEKKEAPVGRLELNATGMGAIGSRIRAGNARETGPLSAASA